MNDDAADRGELVESAIAAVRALEEAQRLDADPAHEDWYAIGGALDQITHRLAGLAGEIARQVTEYDQRRTVRDDAGVDPAVRAGRAAEELLTLQRRLTEANRDARRAHTELSHIAVAPTSD